MDAPDYTIIAKLPNVSWSALSALGNPIERIGHEHTNPGGPASMSFIVAGEHALPVGTQIHSKCAGAPAWTGEVLSAPFNPNTGYTEVQCRGTAVVAQQDTGYEKTYIKQDLSAWQDHKTMVGASAVTWDAAFETQTGPGGIRIAIPVGNTAATGTAGRVTLDMGATQKAKALVITYTGGTAAGMDFRLYGEDTIDALTENIVLDAAPLAAGPTTVGTATAVFTTERRYVGLALVNASGAGKAGAAGAGGTWLNISSVLVVTSTTYESGNASAVKNSTVAADIVANAGIPNISTSTSLIATGATNLAECFTADREDAITLLNRANAVDLDQWRFTRDPTPQLELRDPPTTPAWMLLPGEYELDAESETILDVFNTCYVAYIGTGGLPAIATRTTTVPLLSAQSRTRAYTLKVDRVLTSAEANALGDSFLRENAKLPLRGGLRTTKGYVRSWPDGAERPCALVPAGDMIELPGERDRQTGAWGRRSILAAVKYDHDTLQMEASLDADSTLLDRLMAGLDRR